MDTCEFKDKELEEERVEGGMGRAGLGLICVEFSFFCAFEMKKQSIYQPPMQFPGSSYVAIPF